MKRFNPFNALRIVIFLSKLLQWYGEVGTPWTECPSFTLPDVEPARQGDQSQCTSDHSASMDFRESVDYGQAKSWLHFVRLGIGLPVTVNNSGFI